VKKIFSFLTKTDKRQNILSTALIFILLAITAVMFSVVFRAQNIGVEKEEVGGATIEEVFQNPSDIDDENITKTFWEYMSPEYIVVNKEGDRDILYSSTERYLKVNSFAMEIVKNMYGKTTAGSVVTDVSVWKNMLSVNSVLLHFPADINPLFQVQFLEINENPVSDFITEFSDVLIVTGLPEQKTAIIYVKEIKTEKIVRFDTSMPIDSLNEAINSLENVVDKNYAFGYELKLDNYTGNSTMISSMLTIPMVNIETPVLLAKVPESYSDKLMEVGQNELSRNVMSIFGCDSREVRSYGDTEKSRILLADDRRIVLNADGIIEFYANGPENGIDITGGTVQTESNALYVAVSATLKRILGMFEITGTDIKNADYEIKLTKMECSEDKQSDIKLCFDYYINGHIMEYAENKDSHAVEAVISNGKLLSFKMELKNFVKTGEKISNRQMITAIDEYCSKNKNSGNIYIYDCHLYYGYKKNNEKMITEWAVN